MGAKESTLIESVSKNENELRLLLSKAREYLEHNRYCHSRDSLVCGCGRCTCGLECLLADIEFRLGRFGVNKKR